MASGPDPAPDRYLRRLGLTGLAGGPVTPDRATLERLQRAHVTTVPFETLAITGDPHGEADGAGVSLAIPDLYRKVVERRRGGFCYELNGLFGWLLDALGYPIDRLAAMVVTDGDPGPPANHLVTRVNLDPPVIADVGMGTPAMRAPLPLDGTVLTDVAGVSWRVVDSERPDVTHAVEYREPGGDWSVRYVFDATPRELGYFTATCEYLTSAPESPFTGDPVVTIATEDGHLRLSPDTLTRIVGGERHEEAVAPEAWHDVLARAFGIRLAAPV